VMTYKEGHLKRFIRHVKFEHGIIFNVKYIMASCFLDGGEMEAVTGLVFQKNNLEVTDNTVSDVTLQNIIVRKKVIDINFNTGAIASKVLEDMAVSVSENRNMATKVATNEMDQNKRTRNPELLESSKFKKAKINSYRKDFGKATRSKKDSEEDGKSLIYKVLGDNDDDVDSRRTKYQVETPTISAKPSNFTCDICDVSYARRFTLLKHKKENHDNSTKPAAKPDVSLIESILFDDDEEVQSNDDSSKEGVFVAIEEDASTAKLERTYVELDPFLSEMREKLMQDDDADQMLLNNLDTDQLDVLTAVDEALQNDFVIA